MSFFEGLSADQQKAALEYRGEENHGDPSFLINVAISAVSAKDRRIEEARRFTERTIDEGRRERMRPVALDMIARHEAANKLLFEGLMHHYAQCVCTGRLDLWAKAAHAAVDLIATDRAPFVKRSELTHGVQRS